MSTTKILGSGMVSLFKDTINNVYPTKSIGILDVFSIIKGETYKEKAEIIRATTDKVLIDALKSKIDYVTISGTFSPTRANANLLEHSGFISLDFDHVEDKEDTRIKLENDPYTCAVFMSISGRGFCAIVKNDPYKHLPAFQGLEQYFFEKYSLVIDTGCKDISRARFLSYDPNIKPNIKSEIFKLYPKQKEIPKKQLPSISITEDDFMQLVSKVIYNNIDLTQGEYQRYLNIAWSLIDQLGDSSTTEDIFHSICSINLKYNQKNAAAQYSKCAKSKSIGVTKSTFYYYCKQANISIDFAKSKKIQSIASLSKKSGVTNTGEIVKRINHSAPEIEISENDIKFIDTIKDSDSDSSDNITETVLNHLKLEYTCKRNVITDIVEINGKPANTTTMNSMYNKIKMYITEKASFETMERLIDSDITPDYNPFEEYLSYLDAHYIQSFDAIKGNPIQKLADSIHSDLNDTTKLLFLTKWLIGFVQSIKGQHSPLVLVLCGPPNCGKTEFFRRLLPNKIKEYYCESKLDRGKDDEILMCRNLLILDDEFGGKSKKEHDLFKDLTSKQIFTLREPYGRRSKQYTRYACLSGTSNNIEVISDPTGNRRILPISITYIDHDKYNAINKEELFAYVLQLVNNGGTTYLPAVEVEDHTVQNTEQSAEEELFFKFYKNPIKLTEILKASYYTTTDILFKLETNTKQRLSIRKLGLILHKKGIERKSISNLYKWLLLDLSGQGQATEGDNNIF